MEIVVTPRDPVPKLSPADRRFTIELTCALRDQGVTLEYGSMIIAVSKWWIGAGWRIPDDNEALIKVLTEAIAAWKVKSAPEQDATRFIIRGMQSYRIHIPDPVSPTRSEPTGTGGKSIADAIRDRSTARATVSESPTPVGSHLLP
jgi:hypothetical protein